MPKYTDGVLPTAGIIASFLVLAGCASGPKIITNSAPDFNLDDYRTYSYLQPLSSDRGEVRSLISTYLINATDRELQSSGLRRVEDDGDLLIAPDAGEPPILEHAQEFGL